MANTHSIDSLRELNAKLNTTIAELKKENAGAKAENAKLKQALKNQLFHSIGEEKIGRLQNISASVI